MEFEVFGRYDPADANSDLPTIAGHLHPLCRIGRAGLAFRLPCFLLGENLLVLPAFGTFNAGHIIKAKAGQTLCPIAKETVFEYPPSPGASPPVSRPY